MNSDDIKKTRKASFSGGNLPAPLKPMISKRPSGSASRAILAGKTLLPTSITGLAARSSLGLNFRPVFRFTRGDLFQSQFPVSTKLFAKAWRVFEGPHLGDPSRLISRVETGRLFSFRLAVSNKLLPPGSFPHHCSWNRSVTAILQPLTMVFLVMPFSVMEHSMRFIISETEKRTTREPRKPLTDRVPSKAGNYTHTGLNELPPVLPYTTLETYREPCLGIDHYANVLNFMRLIPDESKDPIIRDAQPGRRKTPEKLTLRTYIFEKGSLPLKVILPFLGISGHLPFGKSSLLAPSPVRITGTPPPFEPLISTCIHEHFVYETTLPPGRGESPATSPESGIIQRFKASLDFPSFTNCSTIQTIPETYIQLLKSYKPDFNRIRTGMPLFQKPPISRFTFAFELPVMGAGRLKILRQLKFSMKFLRNKIPLVLNSGEFMALVPVHFFSLDSRLKPASSSLSRVFLRKTPLKGFFEKKSRESLPIHFLQNSLKGLDRGWWPGVFAFRMMIRPPRKSCFSPRTNWPFTRLSSGKTMLKSTSGNLRINNLLRRPASIPQSAPTLPRLVSMQIRVASFGFLTNRGRPNILDICEKHCTCPKTTEFYFKPPTMLSWRFQTLRTYIFGDVVDPIHFREFDSRPGRKLPSPRNPHSIPNPLVVSGNYRVEWLFDKVGEHPLKADLKKVKFLPEALNLSPQWDVSAMDGVRQAFPIRGFPFPDWAGFLGLQEKPDWERYCPPTPRSFSIKDRKFGAFFIDPLPEMFLLKTRHWFCLQRLKSSLAGGRVHYAFDNRPRRHSMYSLRFPRKWFYPFLPPAAMIPEKLTTHSGIHPKAIRHPWLFPGIHPIVGIPDWKSTPLTLSTNEQPVRFGNNRNFPGTFSPNTAVFPIKQELQCGTSHDSHRDRYLLSQEVDKQIFPPHRSRLFVKYPFSPCHSYIEHGFPTPECPVVSTSFLRVHEGHMVLRPAFRALEPWVPNDFAGHQGKLVVKRPLGAPDEIQISSHRGVSPFPLGNPEPKLLPYDKPVFPTPYFLEMIFAPVEGLFHDIPAQSLLQNSLHPIVIQGDPSKARFKALRFPWLPDSPQLPPGQHTFVDGPELPPIPEEMADEDGRMCEILSRFDFAFRLDFPNIFQRSTESDMRDAEKKSMLRQFRFSETVRGRENFQERLRKKPTFIMSLTKDRKPVARTFSVSLLPSAGGLLPGNKKIAIQTGLSCIPTMGCMPPKSHGWRMCLGVVRQGVPLFHNRVGNLISRNEKLSEADLCKGWSIHATNGQYPKCAKDGAFTEGVPATDGQYPKCAKDGAFMEGGSRFFLDAVHLPLEVSAFSRVRRIPPIWESPDFRHLEGQFKIKVPQKPFFPPRLIERNTVSFVFLGLERQPNTPRSGESHKTNTGPMALRLNSEPNNYVTPETLHSQGIEQTPLGRIPKGAYKAYLHDGRHTHLPYSRLIPKYSRESFPREHAIRTTFLILTGEQPLPPSLLAELFHMASAAGFRENIHRSEPELRCSPSSKLSDLFSFHHPAIVDWVELDNTRRPPVGRKKPEQILPPFTV